MKRLSWKYIAGFVDGEGCLDVQVNKGNYFTPRLRIALAEQGYDVLEILQNNYGGSIQKRSRNKSKSEWSDSYSWEITGFKRVAAILRNIKNHLIIKKEQANFILWMEQNCKGVQVGPEVRDIAREELKAMKKDPHRLSEKAQEELSKLL